MRQCAGNRLIVGEPAGGASTPRARPAVAALRAAGFEVDGRERIQQDIWYKLWGNMTMNPMSALTGATGDRILDDELVRSFMSRCMAEAAEIGERIGFPIAQSAEERHAVTRKLGAFKTSMLQDVEAGKPVELDALVGVGAARSARRSACRRRTSTRCSALPGCKRRCAASTERSRRAAACRCAQASAVSWRRNALQFPPERQGASISIPPR